MRVTLVAPHDPGTPTGILRYGYALRDHLPAPWQPYMVHLDKWEMHIAGRAVGGTLSTWMALARLRLPPADLCHALDVFCMKGTPDVLTIHDLIPTQVLNHLGARLHYRLLRHRIADVPRIITPTEHVGQLVADEFGLDRERVRAVPQAIDHDDFYPDDGDHPALGRGSRHILVVGAYRPYKGIREIIQAAAGLPDVTVVHAGPPGQGAYHERCMQAVRDTGIDFHEAGFQSTQGLRRLYSGCDVLAYASQDEGFGIPPLEAMACGTPSVLSDIPVLRETYRDLGHYVDSFEPAALQAALADALEDPLPPRRLIRHATGFSWQQTAAKTAQVYSEALET